MNSEYRHIKIWTYPLTAAGSWVPKLQGIHMMSTYAQAFLYAGHTLMNLILAVDNLSHKHITQKAILFN